MREQSSQETYFDTIAYAAFSETAIGAGSDGWVSSIDECHYENAGTCPDCGVGMVRHGLCMVCPTCGYGSCG